MKLFGAVVIAVALTACSRPPAPTPRPEAYPRVEVYGPSYRVETFGPMQLMVNDSVRLDSLSPGWFNLVYPAYGITVNCTLTRCANDCDEILANRRERISRNLGDHSARRLSAPGREIIVAPTALSTPVQFLMTDSASYVLSGVAVSSWPITSPPDSVKPQIEALTADLTLLMK